MVVLVVEVHLSVLPSFHWINGGSVAWAPAEVLKSRGNLAE
jgi:hypothetical protein